MDDFFKVQIETNNINNEDIKLSYRWSIGAYNYPMYNTKLLIELNEFKGGLISFDPKYGTDGQLEFNFRPIFIADSNPPAQVSLISIPS